MLKQLQDYTLTLSLPLFLHPSEISLTPSLYLSFHIYLYYLTVFNTLHPLLTSVLPLFLLSTLPLLTLMYLFSLYLHLALSLTSLSLLLYSFSPHSPSSLDLPLAFQFSCGSAIQMITCCLSIFALCFVVYRLTSIYFVIHNNDILRVHPGNYKNNYNNDVYVQICTCTSARKRVNYVDTIDTWIVSL